MFLKKGIADFQQFPKPGERVVSQHLVYRFIKYFLCGG